MKLLLVLTLCCWANAQLEDIGRHLEEVLPQVEEKRCWLKSYGRGVGKPIRVCPETHPDRDAGLCYPNCADGYKGVAFVCWQNCPNNFRDIGVSCQKPSAYGRGVGYVFWMRDQCERNHAQGCERWGLVWYPKCREGLHNFGCCICTPNCVNGMTDAGAYCTKKTYTRGVGVPLTCEPNEVIDASLCYPPCTNDFKGIGPVCWGACPAGYHQCGALCMEKSTCSDYIREFLDPVTNLIKDAIDKNSKAVVDDVAKILKNLIYPIC